MITARERKNLDKSNQEQAIASWINYLNQVRLDTFLNALNRQDVNLENSLKTIDNALSTINDISFEDFVVRSNKRYCAFNHDSVYIVARISVLTKGGKIVNKDIPAGYCPSCGCYYITQYDFDIIGEYGIPLCQQFTQEEYLQIKTGERRHFYKANSILSQMGYNVGQKDNLSNTQRRDILSLAIDKGIYSKAQLDSFLNWLISSRKQNPSMGNAIDRWQDDRLFIKDYKKGDCKIVGVKSITGKLKAKLK